MADRKTSKVPLGLTLGALGVVYGDIGTSPLYAIRESLGPAYHLEVDRANVLGVLSLVFWSLVLVIGVKYVAFILRADNHGEGGILALTALIGLPADHRRHHWRRRWLILLGLFGTSLLYGDGAITPAISVLAAVEGLEDAAPGLDAYVIPIAIVILIGLFSFQRRGTAAVGSVFGPVMLTWFAVIAALGTVALVREPSVLSAVNPIYAVDYFIANRGRAFLSLGSIFLVVTGGEALYADLGHFGRRPIRLGWFSMVMPALLLNYFGQGAMIIREPFTAENPFFRLAPMWGRLPLVVLATAATVIASQALISGAYSLTMQAVQLDYAPRVRIKTTSEEEAGQIYVPAVNWALMIACIGLVIGFRTSSALAAAYGVAVTTTMVVTTMLFAVVARERFAWPRWVTWLTIPLFLAIDLSFFGANIFKVPHGGWFPLVVGVGVFTMLTTWRHGRQIMYRRMRRGETPLDEFIASVANRPVARVPGTAVYMFPMSDRVPPSLLANLRHNHILHESVVILTVDTASRPRVHAARRAQAVDLGVGFWRVSLAYGFADVPNVPRDLQTLVDEPSFDPDHTTYFIGRERVRPTPRASGMMRWRERLFALLHRNSGNAADHFGLPPGRVVEIGMPVEI